MNSPTVVAISTIAYTYMGIELLLTSIITIAMHYGIANNPSAVAVVHTATLTTRYACPVWREVLVSMKEDNLQFSDFCYLYSFYYFKGDLKFSFSVL